MIEPKIALGPPPPPRPIPEDRAQLERRASYPEHNPNLVIELKLSGELVYCNPVASTCFPDLPGQGLTHPFLKGLSAIIRTFRRGQANVAAQTVNLGESYYEQKICFIPPETVLIYGTDISAIKQAEVAIERLAEQRRQLAQRIVHAQEEERRRIAAELHDEAGQALTVLRISLELLAQEFAESEPGLAAELQAAVNLVHGTHQSVRALAHGLRPPRLDALGLNGLLEATCRGFATRTALRVDYRGIELGELDEDKALAIYRFVQEALTNILRHAHAGHAQVEMAEEAERIRIQVQDDGRGFPPQVLESKSPSGIGLAGMAERLSLVGGGLEILSQPGRGARLLAWVPREHERVAVDDGFQG